MALAARITETGTIARINALVAQDMLSGEMARDLTDSLYFFMGLKLKAGLAELDTGRPVTGSIDVEKLSSLDRDLLKDTLGVVKRFKILLRLRFHLESVG
jgi:CBS domain-containing protein